MFALRRFSTRAGYREHMMKHSNTSTHGCRLCGKRFKRVQNARQHLRLVHEMDDADDISANVEKLFLSGVDRGAAEALR